MTVRARFFRAAFALLLLPVGLIVVTATAVRGYYAVTDSSAPDRTHRVPVDPRLIERTQQLIATDPDGVLNQEFLDTLVDDRPHRAVGVYRSGAILSYAPVTRTISDLSHMRIDLRLAVTFSNDESGEVRFLSGHDRRRGEPGGPWFLLVVLSILLIGNGLISRRAARRIVDPLTRLRDWADRLEAGHLGESLQPSGDREIRDVMASIEAMRERLYVSLARQLASDRSRRELIAALSHDLRTPITAIKGYVEGLRDGIAKSGPDRERYLRVITEKAAYLERMIGDLFEFSKLELERLDVRYDDVRPVDLIESVAGDFADQIMLEWTVREPVVCRADVDHLRRAIANILINSISYTEQPPATLTCSVEKWTDRGTRISIADDGPGVAPDRLERIFDPLFREDPARRREGTGLGLTVVRQVALAHGGHAWAEAVKPHGLRIVMELP